MKKAVHEIPGHLLEHRQAAPPRLLHREIGRDDDLAEHRRFQGERENVVS